MKNSIHKGKIHCPFPEPSGLCRVGSFVRRKGGSHVGEVGTVFYIEGAPRVLGVWGQGTPSAMTSIPDIVNFPREDPRVKSQGLWHCGGSE